MAIENASRVRAEDVDLVGQFEATPVFDTKVVDDLLLPGRLVCFFTPRETKRNGYRQRQSLAPRDMSRDRQNGRRVASSRKAHDARRTHQTDEHRLLERFARRAKPRFLW